MLVPPEVIDDPVEFQALSDALAEAAEATLSFPSDWGTVAGEGQGAGGGGSGGGVGGGGDVETDEAALSQRGRGRLAVPDVRFDQLLGALLALVPRFNFVLPPYFLNNARALGTLEGMARTAGDSTRPLLSSA